jgi:amidase
MRLDEYVAYDGVGLGQLLAKGEITPGELGDCLVQAVGSVNSTINAVVELYQDALDTLPERPLAGPFHGIPTLTKDFPIEAGRPAEFGSQLAKGFRAGRDSTYWTRLRAGGLVNVGRTSSSEFGVPATTETLLYGASRNPWNPARGVAGSSGGAAAAVAAGIVPFAQGSDGGGSIRNPASFCGLIGLKPSRGRVTGSPSSVAPLLGLGTAFMLTRSVRDTALLLDLCHGPDAGDGYEIAPPRGSYSDAMNRTPTGLRIALCTTAWSGCAVDPEVAAAANATAKKLAGLGHHVEEASPQFDYASFLAAQKIIWAADSAAGLPALARQMGRQIDENTLGASVLALHRFGLTLGADALMNAISAYDQVTRQFGRFLAGYDLLLTPTAAILPELIGTYDPGRAGIDADMVFADLEPKETFTALFNATGQPAISLPAGRSRDGLPIGVQVVARFGREDMLLAVARQLEQELEGGQGVWNQGRPEVHAAAMELT